MRVASFDLGTNSFLCLISDWVDGNLVEVYDESRVVRLGQGLYDGKEPRLSREALTRAADCLKDFNEKAIEYGVVKKKAVATSAARDATNASELFQICENLGIELEVISGEREAELTFKGTVSKLEEKTSYLVVDIGGGSTELLLYSEKNLQRLSLNVGAVRLTDLFVSCTPNDKAELEAMRKHIRETLQSINMELNPDKVYAVAGTPTSIAAMKLSLKEFDKNRIDKMELKLEDIEIQIRRMQVLDINERASLPGMQKGREDILLTGAIILEEILNFFGIGSAIVSTKGVRYGLAKEMH